MKSETVTAWHDANDTEPCHVLRAQRLFYSDSSPIIVLPLQLTDWLTNSYFSKLDWCGSGLWKWQLKNCRDCYCCSCWQSETCWQHFGADLEGDLVIKLSFCSYFEHKVSKFGQYFEVDVQARFWSWSLVIVLLLMLHVIMKFKIGLVKSFVSTCDLTSRSYFDEQNSTLGSIVPLAMFWKWDQSCNLDNFPFVRAMHLLENILRSIWADIKRWYQRLKGIK